mgnify:CR=1 FL=1
MGHSKELGFNSEYKGKPSETVEQRTAGGFFLLGLLLLLDKNEREGKNYIPVRTTYQKNLYIPVRKQVQECQRDRMNQSGSGGG